MADQNQTTERKDGLYCVYGRCRGFPYSSQACHPGCVFQMSAVSELEFIGRPRPMTDTDLATRHALKIMQLAGLLREARNSHAADIVPDGWAARVDAALEDQNG